MNKCQCVMGKIAGLLVFVGGLNWGLVGVGMLMGKNLNLVNMLLGKMPTVEAVVYLLVGVCAIVALIGCKCAKCKSCMVGAATTEAPKM